MGRGKGDAVALSATVSLDQGRGPEHSRRTCELHPHPPLLVPHFTPSRIASAETIRGQGGGQNRSGLTRKGRRCPIRRGAGRRQAGKRTFGKRQTRGVMELLKPDGCSPGAAGGSSTSSAASCTTPSARLPEAASARQASSKLVAKSETDGARLLAHMTSAGWLMEIRMPCKVTAAAELHQGGREGGGDRSRAGDVRAHTREGGGRGSREGIG